MSTTWVIRPFQAQDRQSVIELWNEAFPGSSGHNDPAASIDRKLAARDDLFFVAADGEQVLGTILAGYDGHRGWLYSVAVRSSSRRRGIGAGLVRYAESILVGLGCPKINLQVRSDNAQVEGFYAALGYATEARISMGKILDRHAGH